MSSSSNLDLRIGILASSFEACKSLAEEVEETGMCSVVVEAAEYCKTRNDESARKILKADPEIVIVDLEEFDEGVESLQLLNSILPKAWLFVASDSTDPEKIIEAMRAGAREFISKPVTAENLSQALTRFRSERKRRGTEVSRGQIYCVTAAKGGSGATSVAISLVASLAALQDTRVALIDLNQPMGDAAAYLNLKPTYSVQDALAQSERLDPVLLESLMSRADGFGVLPGVPEYVPGQEPEPGRLAKLIEVASQTYTHSVVDLPSGLDEESMRVVTDSASAVIVVLTPELPALWRTHRLLTFLERTAGMDKLRLVVNRSAKGDLINEKEIQKVLEHPVYWSLPNDYGAAISAINSGKPIVSVNHSQLSRSYRELAGSLSGIPAEAKKKGFLNIFG